MKIIDLLNKIANNEEVPKKIIAGSEECEYFYDSEVKDYRNKKNFKKLFEDELEQYIKYYLNDEVEIIEPQEHKIPKKLIHCYTDKLTKEFVIKCFDDVSDKINEIIDYLEVNNEET